MHKKLLFTLIIAGLVAPILAMEPVVDNFEEKIIAAIRNDLPHEVEVLIKSGWDAQRPLTNHGLPLYWAAQCKSLATCKMLITLGADVNAQNESGYTALMLGALGLNTWICQLLLKEGALAHIQNNTGQTALHIAANRTTLCITGDDKYRQANFVCHDILSNQKQVNQNIITLLFCLKHIQKNRANPRHAFYDKEDTPNQTVIAHLKSRYVPIKQLLNMEDNGGNRACDIYPVDMLNPDAPEKKDPYDRSQKKGCAIQ